MTVISVIAEFKTCGRCWAADAVQAADEVAGMVFQLCGKDFGYVTGTEIFLTGGQHLF